METGHPIASLIDLDDAWLLTLREAHEQRFTRTEEMLAALIDVTQVATHNFVVAHTKSGARIPPPPPRVPRPGERQGPRRQASPQEVHRFMAAMRG